MSEQETIPVEVVHPDGTVTDTLGNFLGIDQPAARQANLYAALARAQGAFPPIPRDRTVTVQTKTGGAYTFSYAPLETVFTCLRPALTAEGLAVTQVLDASGPESMLRTILLHADGGQLESIWPLRAAGTPQEFGSALTYLRRYALVALLGVASEEDDDGNHASGNTATQQKTQRGRSAAPRPASEPAAGTQSPPEAQNASQETATPEEVAVYRKAVEDAGFAWEPAAEALAADGGTVEALARHQTQLANAVKAAKKAAEAKS